MINKSYQAQVIDSIKSSAGATIPLIIKSLVDEHATTRNRLETSWTEYKGDVPILSEPKLSNSLAPDNRPTHDFRGLIVQEKTSYLTGIPIKYSYPDLRVNVLLQEFLKKNNYESLDSNTVTYLAATGLAFRLLYLSENIMTNKLEVSVCNQLPWECIVITDSTLSNLPVYGIIYYKVEIKQKEGSSKWRNRVEFYDSLNVWYFIENDSGNYVPDTSAGGLESEEHGFDMMPLVQFDNNLLKLSDFEKVDTLINSYDNAMSYALNDNQSFSNALMLFKNVTPTQELIDSARLLRAIELTGKNGKDANVEYLTKDIKIDNTKELTDILEENIYTFSATVDIHNEKFSGGNVSGEARKQQLIPLELKSKETERLLQLSLRNMFDVAATYWLRVKGIIVLPEEIDYIFTRSIAPAEIAIDQVIKMYENGMISHETALSKISFIDNPLDEIKKIEDRLTNKGEE